MIILLKTKNRARKVLQVQDQLTRIAVLSAWILAIPGVYLVVQPGTIAFVIGLVTLMGVLLFLGVAFIFSFAVLKSMRGKGKEDEVKESHVRTYPMHTIPKIQKYPRDE